jgi:hypothetical protein
MTYELVFCQTYAVVRRNPDSKLSLSPRGGRHRNPNCSFFRPLLAGKPYSLGMSAPLSSNELDLAIPDMDSQVTEQKVQAVLEGIKGIESVRLIERGAWLRHHPDVITADQICQAIRHAGFRVSIFQDSTGRTGLSSQ